jgi:hypothetical protein
VADKHKLGAANNHVLAMLAVDNGNSHRALRGYITPAAHQTHIDNSGRKKTCGLDTQASSKNAIVNCR